MILTQRERYIAIGLGVVLGLFTAFEAIIKPYFDTRSAVADEVDSAIQTKQQNNAVLAEQSKLRREFKKMIADGLSDSQSEAKGQIRDSLDQWSRGCGISEKTLTDGQIIHEGDFDQINFKLSGWGTTKNIAMLLNQCETTTLPLRVTKFAPTPVKEGQDYILFELTVSTLYRRTDVTGADRGRVSDVALTGGMAQPVVTASLDDLRPLAVPYKVLLTRSIFARDNRAAPDIRPHPEKHADSSTTQTAPAEVAPDPEASYILRGVGIEDGVYTAVFEQTSENKGVSKHVGELVARGRVTAMSLDGIEYSLNGKTSHVVIGQALDGHIVNAPQTAPATTTSTPSSGAGDKPSWWGHHSHSETPAAPATAPGTQPSPTTAPANATQNPWGASPAPPDGGTGPFLIIDPQ